MPDSGLLFWATLYLLPIRHSGRFVKQEQWERWRVRRKLIVGSSLQAPETLLLGSGCITPRKKIRACIYANSCNNLCIFSRKWFAGPSVMSSLAYFNNGNAVATRFPSNDPIGLYVMFYTALQTADDLYHRCNSERKGLRENALEFFRAERR